MIGNQPISRAQINPQYFSLVAGQTAIAAVYTPNYEFLYLDGVLLQVGVDYTTNEAGTELTLTEPALAGQTAIVIAFGTFESANYYEKPAVDAAVLDAKAGRKNLLINGDMGIAQRGTSFTAPQDSYTLDRWWVRQNGTPQNVVQGVAPLPVGGRSFINFAAGATNYTLRQMVEGVESLKKGSTYTLSFRCLSVNPFDVPWAVSFADTLGGGGAVTIAGGTVTGCGGQGIANPTDWTTHSVTFTVNVDPVGTNNGVLVSIVGLTSDSINFSMIQLEEGDTATDFEYRPIAEELALCQRYYINTVSDFYGGTAAGRATWFTSPAAYTSISEPLTSVQFPVQMRVDPTVAVFSWFDITQNTMENSSAVNVPITAGYKSAWGFTARANNATMAANLAYGYLFTADAEL